MDSAPWTNPDRWAAYLDTTTGEERLPVDVDPDAERVLFDVPVGIELASRTALLTIPRPELAKILPFPEQRAADSDR